MLELALPGPAALGALSTLAGVGVLGLFGGSDDDEDELDRIAQRLDARADPAAIARKLDDLKAALDDLAADADLDRHLRSPPEPDASSVEKAEALSRAVERGQLSMGPGSAGDGGGTVASAATRLQRERSPSSPAGRQLLDALAAPERTDADDLEAALADATEALDDRQALERGLQPVSGAGDVTPNDARRVRDELAHLDAEVAADVVALAEAAETGHSTAERRESERDRLVEAADSLTAAASDAVDPDVSPDSGRPPAERLGVLADAVDRDELGFTDGESSGGQAASVATEVRREARPESPVAKRLLDRLSQPGMGDLRAALETAVDHLDTAPTTEDIVDDVDPEAVRELADDVESDLAAASGPVADALDERIEDLRGTLDRASESNVVFPYAVREELEFYDRTLVSRLDEGAAGAPSATSTGTGSGPADADAVADRRTEFEDRYVDGRHDHNHTIPLHFLSLVDDLLADAERAADGGEDSRATGLVEAADETLDYVEQLYERTEYSVMLRQLRG
ncbi:hypothetical protein [Halorussus halobius]|uniref:hypothetical protein n=1 Tax=Halorussus halobius TaxID=1710537 RepID=UPI00143D5BCC|nr:hypothetical protein [Halorussus halobius]